MKFSNCTFGMLLVLLFILNCLDAFLTLYWVSHNYALEINPIMSDWLLIGDKPFLFVKIFIVLTACFCLWKTKKNKLAHLLVFLIISVHVCVLLIHFNIAWKVFLS